MSEPKTELLSPFLLKLVKAIETKRKGIKHAFQDWSYEVTKVEEREHIEFIFKRRTEKPSTLTVLIDESGNFCLDMRTYAKHDGWEFEHRTNGTLRDTKFDQLISLIKSISVYFRKENINELDRRVKELGT